MLVLARCNVNEVTGQTYPDSHEDNADNVKNENARRVRHVVRVKEVAAAVLRPMTVPENGAVRGNQSLTVKIGMNS